MPHPSHINRITSKASRRLYMAAAVLLMQPLISCDTIDDERVPNLPVSINLSDNGLWNMYGVSSPGVARYFIRATGEPADFHFAANTYTGFGGVLLIYGQDPVSGLPEPLAYDLACPVERRADVRVRFNSDTFEAVCPDCQSHYNVFELGGYPTSGPAATGKRKLGLRRYSCLPGNIGGYVITN